MLYPGLINSLVFERDILGQDDMSGGVHPKLPIFLGDAVLYVHEPVLHLVVGRVLVDCEQVRWLREELRALLGFVAAARRVGPELVVLVVASLHDILLVHSGYARCQPQCN